MGCLLYGYIRSIWFVISFNSNVSLSKFCLEDFHISKKEVLKLPNIAVLELICCFTTGRFFFFVKLNTSVLGICMLSCKIPLVCCCIIYFPDQLNVPVVCQAIWIPLRTPKLAPSLSCHLSEYSLLFVWVP